jgi:hypothetical protein
VLNSWTLNKELEELMVFLSDVAADVLRPHPVWLLDCTFNTAPVPFYQVTIISYQFDNQKI